MTATAHIPVNVLTGFLGSGKTTLLRRLLGEPAFADCAVLINEIGEIGLDHHLLDSLEHETVVLRNGCVCCSVREDLRQALLDLHDRRERGVIPAFNRVVIETTGLADPLPVIATLNIDPVLRHHYRLGNVVTTIDAVHALDQARAHPEWSRQVAVADRLVITKTDLSDAARIADVRDATRAVNAVAWECLSSGTAGDADILLTQDVGGGDVAMRELRRWFPPLGVEAARQHGQPLRSAPAAMHSGAMSTLALEFDETLDWVAFGIWLSMLLHSRGADIVRVKGILAVQGSDTPIAIHGVRHMIHPPMHLTAWPYADRRSRLVMIGRLPDRVAIMASLRAFHVVEALTAEGLTSLPAAR